MIQKEHFDQFSQSLSQSPIVPTDPNYNEARKIWNGMIDKQPAAIVKCTNAADIVTCINFARDQNMLISVKGAGHNVAGKSICHNGVVLDLSEMNKVVVNQEEKTVLVQPGATIGEVDKETSKYGLATPVGIVSKTGIAGLTLGGGYGYLGRTYGLTCDNLISAEIVTAQGEMIQANEAENPDLFWALRGGGGNFGVVTSFKFKCHEVGPDVMVAKVFYPIEDIREVLNFYREFSGNAPDELTNSALVVRIPPIDPFPESIHGNLSILLLSVYSSDINAGKLAMKPLESFGRPLLRVIAPIPFLEVQTTFDEGMPSGMRYYWKSHFLESLSEKAIDDFVQEVRNIPGPFSLAGFDQFGGAYNKVGVNETAFPERRASYIFGVWGGWIEPSDDKENINWIRGMFDKMKPYATGVTYSNFLDQDDDNKVAVSFGSNYKRLQQVKSKYDPDNFFSLNQNIKPINTRPKK